MQTIAAQQKQLLTQKQTALDATENREKLKVPVSVQQQIIQSVTPQHLQTIKNVTLLRTQSTQNLTLATSASTTSQPAVDQSNIVTVAVSKPDSITSQPSVHIKTHANLTPAQQQQILQTIKQKILPNSGILNNQQQQIILKQKSGILQLQKQNATIGSSQVAQQKNTGGSCFRVHFDG